MKQLIIAEKPSLAKTIVQSIPEKFDKKDGYFESNSYIVSFAFGHLFSLYDIDDYLDNKEQSNWNDIVLPYIPNEYKFKLKLDFKTKRVDAGVKKQYKVLKDLIHSNSVSSIIHCGDSDREGEIIVRIILEQAQNTKPVYRLWLQDQTETTIQKGLKNLASDGIYDNLANEGYARTYMDWLYGINLTRYATIKSNTLLRVGRVITAITKAVYDRDTEIKNFTPKPFLVLKSEVSTNGEVIPLKVKKEYSKEEFLNANELAELLNRSDAVVTKIEENEKTVSAPKLFSQSTLQNYLSKKHGYTPDTTLSLVQSLYEKGLVSYPRTPTEYMATAEKEKVKEIIGVIQSKAKFELVFKDTKRIFDDSKIESHSAITPTTKSPDSNSFSSEAERNCYEVIYRRFCAVFFKEECIEKQSKMYISCANEEFEVKGVVSLKKGWKAVEVVNTEDKQLPSLVVGSLVNHNFKVSEELTKPKNHYTVSTLNNFLKNPFREEIKDLKDEDADDSKEYEALLKGLEIGTEATRSNIIKTASQSKYISLEKSTYKILPKGIYLVETLEKLGIDMSKEKTTFFGSELKKVYLGEKDIDSSLKLVEDELKSIINSNKDVEVDKKLDEFEQIESLGACPICSKNVIENNKAYTCEDRDCRFTIWKDSNFVKKVGGKNLTKTMVKQLLKNGSTNVKGLTSKAGKKYDAEIILEITDKWINLKPNFNS